MVCVVTSFTIQKNFKLTLPIQKKFKASTVLKFLHNSSTLVTCVEGTYFDENNEICKFNGSLQMKYDKDFGPETGCETKTMSPAKENCR